MTGGLSNFPSPVGTTIDASERFTANTNSNGSNIAFALAFCPSDPNRFLVGTSSGSVTHASRLGDTSPPPRVYSGARRRELFLRGGGGRGQQQRQKITNEDITGNATRGVGGDDDGVGDAGGNRVVGVQEEQEEGEDEEKRGGGAAAETGGVTCLSFSPFFLRYFLAGCGDGSVRLYKVWTQYDT